jgi:hypothetical protein
VEEYVNRNDLECGADKNTMSAMVKTNKTGSG